MIRFVPCEKENSVEFTAYDSDALVGKAEFCIDGFNMNFISINCSDDVIIEGLARSAMNYAANRNAYIASVPKELFSSAFEKLGFSGNEVLSVEIPEALMTGCSCKNMSDMGDVR